MSCSFCFFSCHFVEIHLEIFKARGSVWLRRSLVMFLAWVVSIVVWLRLIVWETWGISKSRLNMLNRGRRVWIRNREIQRIISETNRRIEVHWFRRHICNWWWSYCLLELGQEIKRILILLSCSMWFAWSCAALINSTCFVFSFVIFLINYLISSIDKETSENQAANKH